MYSAKIFFSYVLLMPKAPKALLYESKWDIFYSHSTVFEKLDQSKIGTQTVSNTTFHSNENKLLFIQ